MDWNTLLCSNQSDPQNHLSAVRTSSLNSPDWRKKYHLTSEFQTLKNRDVVSDLRLLLQHIREAESAEGVSSIWEPIDRSTQDGKSDNDIPPTQVKRSVLEISTLNIPKLKRSNWSEWNALVQDLVTPCHSALDVLMNGEKEGIVSQQDQVEIDLYIFLHNILPSNLRHLAREVKEKEGPKGSALYQAIAEEMSKSYRERLEESHITKVLPIVLFLAPSFIATVKQVYVIPVFAAFLSLSIYLYNSHYDTCKVVFQRTEKCLVKLMTVIWLGLLCISLLIAKEILDLFVVMQDQLEYLKVVMQAPSRYPESEGILQNIYKFFQKVSEKFHK